MMNNVTEYYWELSPNAFADTNASSSQTITSIAHLPSDSVASVAAAAAAAAAAVADYDFNAFLLDVTGVAGSNASNVSTTTIEPDFSQYFDALQNDKIGLLVFLTMFSITTIFGNSLVIMAVIRERYLHTCTNYFVTSLAVADCLVGLVVMPFSALYEVLENTWFFGEDWCDIWRCLDVLFSTASILNLCVISLDRYWAITDPFSYPMKMTPKRAAGLIGMVWVCSSAISFPAIVWWRATRDGDMPAYKCNFTDHLGYLVFSSTISFYLPLLVMVFTYCRIYRAAVIQTRSLKLGTKQVMMAQSGGDLQLTLRIHRGGTTRDGPGRERRLRQISQQQEEAAAAAAAAAAIASSTATSTPEEPDEELLSGEMPGIGGGGNGLAAMAMVSAATPGAAAAAIAAAARQRHLGGKNFSLSRKLAKFAKEKKAAKTLGIVMGVFIVCWLPFFVVNLLSGFCVQCIAHEEIVSAVVTWLGWINSSMNPVIYACWSRDFRRAFVRILCVCCPRKVRRRYQPAMRSKSQCQVVTSTSASYTSVNQCEAAGHHSHHRHHNSNTSALPAGYHTHAHTHSHQHAHRSIM